MIPAERSSAVIIFMRAPFQDSVKTRLAKTIGQQKASQFYHLCVDTIISQINELPPNIEKHIFFAEPVEEAAIDYLKDLGFNIEVQTGETLGIRLRNAFYKVFQSGTSKAVIVASDVPDLTAGIVEEAISRLDSNDVVIGPSHDGGYYLIGLRKINESLFKRISWGTGQVCRQTLDAADKEELTVRQLPILIDIDTAVDLRRWTEIEGHKNQAILDFARALRL